MRIGLSALIIAAIDLLLFGSLIVVRFRIPDGWIDTAVEVELERIARWVLLGNIAIILFPIIALIGAGVSVFGVVRNGWRDWIAAFGLGANGFLVLLWIIGMVWYFLTYRFDRLYVK